MKAVEESLHQDLSTDRKEVEKEKVHKQDR